MSDTVDPTPRWARRAHEARSGLTRPVAPFDALDATWKSREAVGAGVIAAGGMALLNVLTGVILWSGRYPKVETLAARLNLSLPFLHLVAAIVLAWIAVRLHRTRSVTLAWVVLVWAVADLTLINLFVYGHAGMRYVSPLIALAAILGLRGAMRLRRQERRAAFF